MRNRIRNSNVAMYYFISVISHVMILLAAVMILDFSSETLVIGDHAEQLVQAYLSKVMQIRQRDAQQTCYQNREKDLAKKNSACAMDASKTSSPICFFQQQ